MTTLAQGLLKAQLSASVADTVADILDPNAAEVRRITKMDDHEFLANDLRNHVQEGHDITAEEMLIISDNIRRGRRTAAALAAKANKASGGGTRARTKQGQAVGQMNQENLTDLLDQAL